MTDQTDIIVAFLTHARAVRSSERTRFAEMAQATAAGSLILQTCHRVEVYGVRRPGGTSPEGKLGVPAGGQVLEGEAAVRHAIAVAVGRDSVVIGEDQVLHQMRRSLDVRMSSPFHPALERLFMSALHAGRLARSWQQGPRPSLADVAMARIERMAGPIQGREVLIVGAGQMGRLLARAAAAAGASVAVANRSSDAGARLASEVGGRTEQFDPGGALGDYLAVAIALGGPWLLGPQAIEALVDRSTIVADLSAPPAIPESLAARMGARLVTGDDLAVVDAQDASPQGRSMRRLDALIAETADEFLEWLDGHQRRAVAAALVERADRERAAALAELWRRLPDLDLEARETIEGMSRHLAERLLRDPLARLGTDVDGHHERAVRELWAL